MSVNLLLILFVLIVVAMVAFILVQKGTGATAGSAFGSGASNTVFGAKGSGNFLTKTTMTLAFLFFAISMYMAVQASKEFTVADTGEIDLGVVGSLNTSDSDVPEMLPVDSVESQLDGDVPSLNEKIEIESDAPAVEDVINKAMDDAKDVIDAKAEEIKDVIDTKVEEIKDDASAKAEEVKDSVEG